MPELPEIETIRLGLLPSLKGRQIKAMTLTRPDLRYPFPDNLAQNMTGKRISDIRRRGKYLLFELQKQANRKTPKIFCWLVHLGMSGRLVLHEKKASFNPEKHDHMWVCFDDGKRLVYNDPRRFGFTDFFPKTAEPLYPAFGRMGVEPLSPSFQNFPLHSKLNTKTRSIKDALLDQRLITGLGNIYVLEALFLARISPFRKSCLVTKKEAEILKKAIAIILKDALKSGGSSLRDYRKSDGTLGYFQHKWKVYQGAGKPCPLKGCGGEIIGKKAGGRMSFYCPAHQK